MLAYFILLPGFIAFAAVFSRDDYISLSEILRATKIIAHT